MNLFESFNKIIALINVTYERVEQRRLKDELERFHIDHSHDPLCSRTMGVEIIEIESQNPFTAHAILAVMARPREVVLVRCKECLTIRRALRN